MVAGHYWHRGIPELRFLSHWAERDKKLRLFLILVDASLALCRSNQLVILPLDSRFLLIPNSGVYRSTFNFRGPISDKCTMNTWFGMRKMTLDTLELPSKIT